MSENKDLKAKADKCLRLIKTAKKSIHVPNEAKPKKEIIDDITNSLDKDILRQVKEAIDNFPCLLLIGNEDKGSLAACYAHCNRDIDYYGNFINKYKQRLEEQGKYSPYIHGLDIHNNTFFEYVPCFSYNLLPFEYVDKFKRLTDLFSKGYTVFLDRLELESEDEDDGYTFKSFIGSLKDARANMPTGSSGLFIISIDSISDLPKDFRKEFRSIMLDGEEAGVERKATLPQGKTQGTLKDKIPPETKWSDIDMVITDKEYKTLDISIKGGRPFTVNCRELGLESAHSHKPLKAWWVLMEFAKVESNEIPSSGKELKEFAESASNLIPSEGSTLFGHIAKLREKLSENIDASGDPIPYIKEKDAYQTLFHIKDTPYAEEYKKSIQDGGNVKCDGCGKLIKNYTHDNVDDMGYNVCDTCLGKKVHHDEELSEEHTYDEDIPDEWD